MRRVLPIVLLACAALDAACSDPPPPPPPPPKPKVAPVLEVVDAGMQVETRYVYNPVGKRDPFRTPLDEPGVPKGDQLKTICQEPLCQMDLDSLTLVAVVTGDADPVAMVEDTARIGFIVHRGTRMGKQGGKVTQISRDCVEVTEFFQTPDGKLNPNKVNLCVKADTSHAATLDLLNNRNVE